VNDLDFALISKRITDDETWEYIRHSHRLPQQNAHDYSTAIYQNAFDKPPPNF
jgi:hypothetical protein